MLYLYKISRPAHKGYSTYTFAIVVAANENDARQIKPQPDWVGDNEWDAPEILNVELVGIALDTAKSGDVIAYEYFG